MDKLTTFEKQQMKGFIIEQGFEGRKATGRLKKQIIAVAAAVLIGIPAFGFTFPAIAANIPRIFDLFYTDEVFQTDRLQEFAQEVNITGEVNRMSISIEEAVFK